MKFDRRRFLTLAGSAVAAPAVLRVTRANAQEVTLRMHHFLPPVANGHAKFLKPWADKVAAEFEWAGSRSTSSRRCSSAARRLSSSTRRAMASPIWSGRCRAIRRAASPASRRSNCPSSPNKRALVNSLALTDYAEQNLKDEFKDVKPICFWAHDHGLIHANKQVKTMEDLKGLKLRFPTRLAGEALRALGANAIGMPIPQVPESLAQRVIDGCVIPWEVVPSIKVQELVKFHTEIPGLADASMSRPSSWR